MELDSSFSARAAGLLFPMLFLLALGACDGNSTLFTERDPVVEAPPVDGIASEYTGQVLLGPVIDANVQVFSLDDFAVPLCETLTSDSDTIEQAGFFSLPRDCISDDEAYLIVSSGGWDIDVDDDGNRDAIPTQVTSNVRALVLGTEMASGQWKISALTDSIVQALQYSDLGRLSATELRTLYSSISDKYLVEDINGDSLIDFKDILAWNPVSDHSAIADKDSLAERLASFHAAPDQDGAEIELPTEFTLILDQADAVAIEQHAGLLLVATHAALLVIDEGMMGNTAIVSSMPTSPIHNFTVVGNYVMVALRKGGVQVFDLTDPSHPLAISDEQLGDYVFTELVANNQTVYAIQQVDDEFDLVTIDASVIADLSPLNSLPMTSDVAPVLAIAADHLYALLATNGDQVFGSVLRVFDAAAPQSLTQLGDTSMIRVQSTLSHTLDIDGSTAYVGRHFLDDQNHQRSLELFDISRTIVPEKLDTTLTLPGGTDISIGSGGIFTLTDNTLTGLQLPELNEVFTRALPAGLSGLDVFHGTTYFNGSQLVALELPILERSPEVSGFISVRGPIVGAEVFVYPQSTEETVPACSATSLDNADLEEAGHVSLPLSCVSTPGVYHLRSSGGYDIDSDGDGVRDSTPTAVQGTLSAIMTHAHLSQNGWHISLLTDATAHMLDPITATVTLNAVADALDAASTLLVNADLNADNTIDRLDVYSWLPDVHGTDALVNDIGLIERLASGSYAGISAEATLRFLGIGRRTSINLGGFISSISIDGNTLAATTSTDVFLLDVNDSNVLSQQSRISSNPSSAGLLLTGDTLLVSTTDPAIEWVGHFSTWAHSDSRLEIYDVSDREAPILKSHFAGEYRSFVMINDSLYAIDHDYYRDTSPSDPEVRSKIVRIDLTDQSAPSITATAFVSKVAGLRLATQDEYLFALGVDANGELISTAFDVSTSTHITPSSVNWDNREIGDIPSELVLLSNAVHQFNVMESTAEESAHFDADQLIPPNSIDQSVLSESTISIDHTEDDMFRLDSIEGNAISNRYLQFDRVDHSLNAEFLVPRGHYRIKALDERVFLFGDSLEIIDLR